LQAKTGQIVVKDVVPEQELCILRKGVQIGQLRGADPLTRPDAPHLFL